MGALYVETPLRLGSRYECCEKDDRRSAQVGVGLDLCRYFAAIRLRHQDLEEYYIRFEIAGALMSLGSVVLFHHQIWAGSFEKNFYKPRGIRIIIDNQDALF
jgi:hypothetical protein